MLSGGIYGMCREGLVTRLGKGQGVCEKKRVYSVWCLRVCERESRVCVCVCVCVCACACVCVYFEQKPVVTAGAY